MKYSLFVLLLIAVGFNALAQQVPRVVVVEHFTNTYCSVCANRNPGLFSNLQGFPDVLYISYYPSKPYPACPLNQHNKPENDARTNYYNVFGATPQLLVQGGLITGPFTDPTIFSSQLNKTSSFKITVTMKSVPDSFEVSTVIKKVDTSLIQFVKLYGAVVEDTLFFTAQNGETLHRNVFRKALWPGAPVLSIQAPLNVNDSVIHTARVAKNNAWQLSRMFAIAIMQDDNRVVIQAGRSTGIIQATGVSHLSASELRIFPNPAYDQLTIVPVNSVGIPVFITDITGKKMYSNYNISGATTIHISGWAKGLYYLRAGNSVSKFIKQ